MHAQPFADPPDLNSEGSQLGFGVYNDDLDEDSVKFLSLAILLSMHDVCEHDRRAKQFINILYRYDIMNIEYTMNNFVDK